MTMRIEFGCVWTFGGGHLSYVERGDGRCAITNGACIQLQLTSWELLLIMPLIHSPSALTRERGFKVRTRF